MESDLQRSNGQDGTVSALTAAIEALNLARGVVSIAPAKIVFSSVSAVLAMIRDNMVNQTDYVELGLACAEVCNALDRGLSGKKLDELNKSVREAIKHLTLAVAAIRWNIIEQGRRNVISRHLLANSDRGKVASWKSDLNRILHIFNAELAINTHIIVSNTHTAVSELGDRVASTHTMVSDIHRTIVQGQRGSGGKHPSAQSSGLGETPPLPPRTFFGRDELMEKIVNLAEDLIPIALIGAGGIGKTSSALALLNHNRIKRRFGDHRRFIRCDQFPASRAHLLRRLSQVTGAGVENPEGIAPLRTFLSSKEMLIVLDNAESILDPRGTGAQEIYGVVEELSRFGNICICITSRISTTPPGCKRLEVPTLSIGAARNTFYRIYDTNNRSNLVNGILKELDFHPLSITLLATVAHQNKWDVTRLGREWEQRRTSVLQTEHDKSLAVTIELSLASPLFQELGPAARVLLEVIAFFPQGVSENSIDWLFPTIPNRTRIFDKFNILSLTYRSDGFITMLAPLRDHLSPKDPRSSPLLCATKEHYFFRMKVNIDPDKSNFEGTRWITSEDINIEHLLDIFTTIDANSVSVWDACAYFMQHLGWHKKRLTILTPKIEKLPDEHASKPECLFQLSRLFNSVGNQEEYKRLLTHALKLWRERGNDRRVARMLRLLSDANRLMGSFEEGIQRAKEALEIYQRLGDTTEQAQCLIKLAFLLRGDDQLDAAQEAASRAIDLTSEKGDQFQVCRSHRILGSIYRSKRETEKAIYHYNAALDIASPYNWHDPLFWIHYDLVGLFRDEGRFEDAQVYIERAKSHAVNGAYCLGRAMELQADVWYKQNKLDEAKSEILGAADVYKKLGSTKDVEDCAKLLRRIQKEQSTPVAGG